MATRQELEQALQNPNVRKFLDLLSYTEGTQGNGYYTAFGGGRLPNLNDHPRYSKTFKQTDGKTNRTSAAGRYQFLKGTWDGLAKQYGFKDFSPRNQDLGAVALLAQNGALPHILKGDFGKAVSKAGGTWASLPSSPHPQPTKSWKKVNDFLGGNIAVSPVPVQTPEPQQQASTQEPVTPEYQPSVYDTTKMIDTQQANDATIAYDPVGESVNDQSLTGGDTAGTIGSMTADIGNFNDLNFSVGDAINVQQPDWTELASEVFSEKLPDSLAPKKVSSAIKGAVKNIIS